MRRAATTYRPNNNGGQEYVAPVNTTENKVTDTNEKVEVPEVNDVTEAPTTPDTPASVNNNNAENRTGYKKKNG